MEVRMVAADPAPVPAPEDTPPPEPEPQLESMIQPPLPDLPPPVFPVEAPPPPPPPKPKPPAPKPPQPKPHPAQTATPVQQEAPPSQAAAAPAAPAGPKTVTSSQVTCPVKPNPVYPARARRANEQGVATVRVLIDTTGRPAQAVLQTSSGHAALDEAAISAVKAAQCRPYIEGGVPQAIWVLMPINFVLQ
jgi:protein TonB